MAGVEEWGTPDFGNTLVREHLLSVFRGCEPSLVLIVAPSGYGKSVLAAQLAGSERFQAAEWHDMSGLRVDSRGVVESVFASVERSADANHRIALSLVSQPAEADMLSSIETHYGELGDGPMCVVLDGLAELLDASVCVRILSSLRRVRGNKSCVIATTRALSTDVRSLGVVPWVLETADLALTAVEAQAVLALRGRSDVDLANAQEACTSCGGQVALLSVMAMHRDSVGLGSGSRVSMDLRVHLMESALGQLTPEGRELLFAAALLRTGSCSDLDVLMGWPTSRMLRRVSEAVPLLHVSSSAVSSGTFLLHDHAADVFSTNPLGISGIRVQEIEHRALECLSVRGDFERYFLIVERGSTPELVAALEHRGMELLARGQASLLRRLMDDLPVTVVASRPVLLLLNARLQRMAGRPHLALSSIEAALTLAVEYGQEKIVAESRVLMARILLDLSDTASVGTCLAPLFTMSSRVIGPELLALGHAYMGISLAHGGALESAQTNMSTAIALLDRYGLSGETRGHVLISCLWLAGPVDGDWAHVARRLEAVVAAPGTSVSMSLHVQSNLAWALIQMGHLHRAASLNANLRSKAALCDVLWIGNYADSNESALFAGMGRMDDALDLQGTMIDACRASSDAFSAAWGQLARAKYMRALGRLDESLHHAEEALAYFDSDDSGAPTWATRAMLEVAASRLGLGEVVVAADTVDRVMESLGSTRITVDTLVAALLQAEIARRTLTGEPACTQLGACGDYILSESANWELAMYIRAFPGLLGLVAAAVGVDRLPAHMLRMIMPEHARAALPLARDVLDEDAWRRLAVRLLGEDEAREFESSFSGEPLVHVRLFGGLEVITPDGVVPDRSWRKRKARLLFMMLVARQGRDVPRDMLLEHLWPDMDDERAKNNFYVIWSAMKRALLSAGKAAPCPYVEHVGGICRIVRPLVRSDLDGFDEAVAMLDSAEAAGDMASALMAARQLKDIYRSDLLPSEIYDDWFRPLRERCRVQFGDSMLRVSRMCRDSGDVEQAVHFVRAGLEHDPWREDLYQAAMRCQIDIGQRSGAVDLFMACRSKLSEDLGLDPSLETRRLYEEVLAMEELARE